MTRTRFVTTALLAAFALAGGGCDGDNAFPNDPLGTGGTFGSGVIRGTVSAASGVGGAVVTLSRPVGDTMTITATDGGYRFDGVAAGSYLLSLQPPFGFDFAAADSARKTASVPAGGEAVVNWSLIASGGGTTP
ncbi:hypothetical protein BH20GEM2_BH20GEM2_02490 [soil metagenome]